jgi:hypothetical protein
LIEYTNNFLGNQTVSVNRQQGSVRSDRGWILDEQPVGKKRYAAKRIYNAERFNIFG